MIQQHIGGDAIPANCKVIEIRLSELYKLFDIFDPSPMRSKDLYAGAVEHMVESTREFSFRAPLALVLHLDQPVSHPGEELVAGEAIRTYFTHLSEHSRRQLRLHLRRGVISLFIGLAVLGAALVGSQFLGEGTVASTLRESLDIGGWVALWRPMEMFLYDWWPILGDRMRYRRLGRMPVQVRYPAVS